MKIIRMGVNEVPKVAQLEQQIFSMPWSEQGFYDTLSMDNVIFLVAMEEDVACGYCGVYLAADEGEITNVAVDCAYRRRGIARKLMQELICQASTEGARQLVLEVRKSNVGAIQLYQKLGFTVSGIRRQFYEKPVEDACIMILRQ